MAEEQLAKEGRGDEKEITITPGDKFEMGILIKIHNNSNKVTQLHSQLQMSCKLKFKKCAELTLSH